MSITVYNQIFDSLMEYFSSLKYMEEARSAREEFYKKIGYLDEKSFDFEMKMAQFVDWYLFKKSLKGSKTPIEIVMKEDDYKIEDSLRLYYRNIFRSRHSLFEFIKIKEQNIYVRDLFSHNTMVVKNSLMTKGFRRGEFFQTRIIPHEDYFVFAPFFCFHPPQVRKYILKKIQSIKKLKEGEEKTLRESFIFKLFVMRHKYEQYKHLALNEIYSDHSKLKI